MKKAYNYFLSPNAFLLLWLFVVLSPRATAQSQSGRVYEFINLPSTARITTLGGYAVPMPDNDLGMALYYPSLVNPDLQNQLTLNFVDYFGDISYGTAAFATDFDKAGSFTLAVQYISYGTFTEADEFGNQLGEFSPAEYAISVGWGRKLTDRVRIGSNLKTIFSQMEEYSSFGIAADVSVSYMDEPELFAASLVFRNMGRQIIQYHDQSREKLPFEIVLGASKKLANAPLRFSFVAHNLQKYDLTYTETVSSGQTLLGETEGQATSQERLSDFGDKLLRHAIVGIEFAPTQNFVAGIGYNYRRRQEMKVDTRLSTVGLSWGVGVRISRFMFQYGRSNYHLAGAPNHFSITTNLGGLFFPSAPAPNNLHDYGDSY